jgi:hypothetical protein
MLHVHSLCLVLVTLWYLVSSKKFFIGATLHSAYFCSELILLQFSWLNGNQGFFYRYRFNWINRSVTSLTSPVNQFSRVGNRYRSGPVRLVTTGKKNPDGLSASITVECQLHSTWLSSASCSVYTGTLLLVSISKDNLQISLHQWSFYFLIHWDVLERSNKCKDF